MGYLAAGILSGLVIYLMGLLFANTPSPTERHMDTLSRLHARNTKEFVTRSRWASAREIIEHARCLELPLRPNPEQIGRN